MEQIKEMCKALAADKDALYEERVTAKAVLKILEKLSEGLKDKENVSVGVKVTIISCSENDEFEKVHAESKEKKTFFDELNDEFSIGMEIFDESVSDLVSGVKDSIEELIVKNPEEFFKGAHTVLNMFQNLSSGSSKASPKKEGDSEDK